MKVLAINGSPRGENGCTNMMLQPLLEGMCQAGAKTKIIKLDDKQIHHCIGCFSCWTKTPGKCVFNDDMAELLNKIIGADIIVYATPLYYFTTTGLFKNFLDRCLPLASPFMEENEQGITIHPGRYDRKKRKMLLVSPCGFPELSHFDALVVTFKKIAEAGEAEYLGEILKPAAGLMLIEELQDKVTPYFDLLKQAGKQLIENNSINLKTYQGLHETWISPEEFREQANQYFKSELEKLSE